MLVNIGRHITSKETIRIRTRYHWISLVRRELIPAIWLITMLVLMAWLSPPIDWTMYLVAPPVVWGLWRLGDYLCSEILVTTQRVIATSGIPYIARRRTATMPLKKITDQTLIEPVLGQWLGYCQLDLETAGQDQGIDKEYYVPNRDQWFYRAIMEEIQ